MKIAIFYPKNLYASWYALGGYRTTLERLGYDVTDCPFPGNQVANTEELKKVYPSLEKLAEHDLIISFFHEYSQPWLSRLYDLEGWQRLMEKVPVVARFDESMDRRDLALPDRVPELKQWAKFFSFPATQDAAKYGGVFHPFGADTTIFKPNYLQHRPKKYDVGFIGSLYPSRQDYLRRLTEHVPVTVGSVVVQDLGGIVERASTELLAENYRQIKIFFCLPPLSRLIVCKVFEILACGTFVMYPKLPWGERDNMKIFEDGKDLVYYDPGYLGKNVKQIEHYLKDESERETIAASGCRKVHENYSLDWLCDELVKMKDWTVDHPLSKVVTFSKEPAIPA